MKKILSLLLIMMMLFSFATPVSAQEDTPVNYITNGNFEMGAGGQWGAVPGWTMNIAVGTMDLYIGNYYYDVGRDGFVSDTYIALRKESNPGGDEISVTQTVSDLPVGVYEFSAWMWAAQNTDYFTIRLETSEEYVEIEAIPGVRDYETAEIPVKDGTLTITIAADNVDKTRFMDALADDITLVQIKGEEAFETAEPSPTEEVEATPTTKINQDTDAPPKDSGNSFLPFLLAGVLVVAIVVIVILVIRLRKKS